MIEGFGRPCKRIALTGACSSSMLLNSRLKACSLSSGSSKVSNNDQGADVISFKNLSGE